MERKIKEADMVDTYTLAIYDKIDGLLVIEECLLFKGLEICGATKCISIKFLEQTAHVIYNLKANATNKLYVGMHLDRYYHKQSMVSFSGKIRVPADIYERVRKLNDSYKTADNQLDD